MLLIHQPWKNEKERVKVLSEKHRRGDAARAVRATRRNKAVMRNNESLALKGEHCLENKKNVAFYFSQFVIAAVPFV